jgi:hypothetical protein
MVGKKIMEKFKIIKPYFFQDSLVISLTKEWINHFNGIPEFEVFLDNKKQIHLISKSFQKEIRHGQR